MIFRLSIITFICLVAAGLNVYGQDLPVEKLSGKTFNDISSRLNDRDFPSVFQAWSKAENLKGENAEVTLARHDVYIATFSTLKLAWNNKFHGLATDFTEHSIARAKEYKHQLLELNPNIITLAEVKYRDAYKAYLPEGHKWWMHDKQGNYVYGWEEGKYIRCDFRDTSYQNQVAIQAAALVNTGVVDGIFLDWWTEEEYLAERIQLIKKVRKAIGEHALIVVNSNENIVPNSAPYANGIYMECWDSPEATVDKWEKYRNTLVWAEQNLKQPQDNLLETWFEQNRGELNRMRATTTLALTCSNGCCLFADPDPLPVPDHLHDWYSFYDSPLGKPKAVGFQRADKAYQREFTNGTAIYNPVGNIDVEIIFVIPHKSMATGITKTAHSVPAFDGDIFIPQP